MEFYKNDERNNLEFNVFKMDNNHNEQSTLKIITILEIENENQLVSQSVYRIQSAFVLLQFLKENV